ncbi:MAG: hydantoinase/oxoprolinase family protein, partial [Actinomycetia bacterium]|nr:hydantoinase/oxoprolinase family protein [Actinomycetes bacterium]
HDEESGVTASAKVPTTPDNQAIGVMGSIDAAEVDVSDVGFIAHGTTTGTNALLERKGAVTGLLSTEGFRDVLEIMRTDRESGYDLTWEKPSMMVRRSLRREVVERVDKDGSIEVPLDEQHAADVVRGLLEAGVESIALSLIHSYANPAHERRLRSIIQEISPEVAVSLSSEVNAEYREFERTSTAVIDAYLKPIIVRYIERLAAELAERGLGPRLFIMQGSGGMMTAKRAAEKPITTLQSGPAAGAIAAAKIGAMAGLGDIVTFDVGGTSTDVSLIHGGEPYVSRERAIEWGLPARVPMIDVESVGAGGGSIAWIDEGGGLKVGPQSGGADPGPICYGRGGIEPTLSDALLVKGVLGADLAAGLLRLDRDAALDGIAKLARVLGLEVDRLVDGIVKIAEANMANAVRSVSIWKGLDPRDLTLVAFGGAGGLVAGSVARELDIPRVLVPMHPGNTCAMGLLMTDMQEDASIAFLAEAGAIDLAALNARLDELHQLVTSRLADQGVGESAMSVSYSVDIRYHGQIHELSIPFSAYPVTADALAEAFAHFEQMYVDIYTIRLEDHVPEMTSLRATGLGRVQQYEPGAFDGSAEPALKGSRDVLDGGAWRQVEVFSRYELASGSTIEGPAIIEEPGSTIWVARGMSGEVDDYGSFVITTAAELELARAAAHAKEA